jgi:cell division protein FtsX
MNILRYALQGISRNIGLSASVILIIAFLVFFVCILRFALFSTDVFTRTIIDRLGIVVLIQQPYDGTNIRVQEVIAGIAKGFDDIAVQYISREDALRKMQEKDPKLTSFVETAEDNPLPNTIRIGHIRNLDHYRAIDAYLSSFADVLQYDTGSTDSRLLEYQSQYRDISAIIAKFQILKWAMYIFLALFVLTVVAIISMVIHTLTFFVQDEIRIIELV